MRASQRCVQSGEINKNFILILSYTVFLLLTSSGRSFTRKQPFPNQFKYTNMHLMHSSNYITLRRFSATPFFSSPKNPISFQKFQILVEQTNCEDSTDASPIGKYSCSCHTQVLHCSQSLTVAVQPRPWNTHGITRATFS